MIDFGKLRQTSKVPEREIQDLAQAWVNVPGMQEVALRIAHLCHVPPGAPFATFRGELAALCAEQYLQGRATGRAGIVTLPELPQPRPGADVCKPYALNDSRWKPPSMRQD